MATFIAVTYGYNMYSIFNTNSFTKTLIDIIAQTCVESLRSRLPERIREFEKEIENQIKIEENSNKNLQMALSNKVKEEERLELEKKEEESLNNTKEIKKKDDNKKKPPPQKGKKEEKKDGILQKIINDIELYKLQELEAKSKKEKIIQKLELLKLKNEEIKLIDEKSLQIDLIDGNNVRVEIETKDNIYANKYLNNRDCYELAILKKGKFLTQMINE